VSALVFVLAPPGRLGVAREAVEALGISAPLQGRLVLVSNAADLHGVSRGACGVVYGDDPARLDPALQRACARADVRLLPFDTLATALAAGDTP